VKVGGVRITVDRINEKKAAEQQDLGEQEEPHADLSAKIVAVFVC
jgi:hypothetical protein